MWTPIGSRFSIEQTITTLSARSRTTSSSNSSQPRSDSSTSTWWIGDSARPRSTWRRSSSAVAAKPPPWPPSVKAGRTTAGVGSPSTCEMSVTIVDVGHLEAARLDRVLEELAVLGSAITSTPAPISSIPSSSRIAGLVELEREVERGLAAHRRQERVGPLAAQHRRDAFEVERLQVGRVGEAGVGHDRGRVRVDDDRAVALLAQHLQRLAARVVELAGLPDHDRAGADQADRMDVVTPRQGGPPRPTHRGSTARRAGPGPASGWNCTERARSSG